MSFFTSMLTNAALMSLIVALFLLLRVPLERHIRPASCYAIGVMLCVGLLIPFRPPLPVSLSPTPSPIQQLAAPAVELPETLPYTYDFTTEAHQQRLAEAEDTHVPVQLTAPATQASPAITILQIIAILWLAGIVAVVAYHTVRHLRFRHLIRRWHEEPNSLQKHVLETSCKALAIRKPPRLWQCGVVKSPMLVGLIHPIILLPHLPFSSDELACVLRHELVHLKRHDLWYKALVLASVCLHWWNPLVRRMARAISADCEMSCDDTVLANADLPQRKLYGETILATITRQTAPYAALSTYFYEGRTDMKRRFSSMLNVHPRRVGGLVIVLCLCLTVFTGSVFASGGVPAASIPEGVSPTTGMQYPTGRDGAYRPVLVEISNTPEARQPLSLSLADIVYEYIFWGPGSTRYLALYNDYHPEMAGAVRSSKLIGMSLRNSWDCPIVFSGGADSESDVSLYDFINDHKIPNSMRFDETRTRAHSRNTFSHITTREFPNNGVANLQQLVQNNWPKTSDGAPYEPAMPTLQFADAHAQGDETAGEIIIPYDDKDYTARYTYNAAEGHYDRWYNGSPQIDGLTGQRIIANNVIVLYGELTYVNDSMAQPKWNLTGEGKLDVFIDGQHIAGTWTREDDDAAFAYLDQNASPLVLSPGKTFIQVVPLDMEIHQGS